MALALFLSTVIAACTALQITGHGDVAGVPFIMAAVMGMFLWAAGAFDTEGR